MEYANADPAFITKTAVSLGPAALEDDADA